MNLIVTTVEQGLIYGILALGVYITYKILDFPDLTVDGSFPLGAAVTAALIVRGVNPYLTLLISFGAGVLCRGLHGADPCEMQGKGSAFRDYYDDSTLDDQSPDCRDSECSDLWGGEYFLTMTIERDLSMEH